MQPSACTFSGWVSSTFSVGVVTQFPSWSGANMQPSSCTLSSTSSVIAFSDASFSPVSAAYTP